jgi:PAS domain S-box-containing protein
MLDHGYGLGELIDVARLQRLFDGLSAASGTVLAVLDPDGSILVASGWQDICTRFHRCNETSVAGCLESDQRINERVTEGVDGPQHIAYQCANGLWDVAFPLIIEGRHVATVFTGQFFYDDDAIDAEAFRARAAELGFEETAYLQALERVPILSHDQVKEIINFLAEFVGMLGELGLGALKHEKDHAALAASEDRFRSLAEDMPMLVCSTLADGTITYVNDLAARAAGREAVDLLGANVSTLVDEGTADLVATARETLTAEHPVETHEESRPAADGSLLWHEWTNRGFFDDEGRLVRVQAIGRDVTERRRAEEALIKSELRLRLANRAANDVVWDLDIVNDSQLWIATGETVFGWADVTDGPVPETWWKERVHPDDSLRVHEDWVAVLDDPSATIWVEEYRFRRADGAYAEVLDRAHLMRDDAGRALRVIGAMLDITERRQAEEVLLRTRQQYETFINATDDIAFLKDDQLRYVIVNTANAKYFGLGVEEVVGRADAELMSADAAESCRASDLLALEHAGLVVTTESVGDRVHESRKFPVALADGRTGVGGYVRDVTEQRRAEAEIMRLASDLERRVTQRTAQLEATNRELESFAYAISHDLRSPLRALDGFSEILLQDYEEVLDDTGRDYLRRIKGAANHMAGLMDGLLQLSRLNRDELDFKDVDVSALVSSFVAELRERDSARDVVVDVAPGLVARADPKLMRVVVENLLGNAWKFTARHEKARIEFGADRSDGGTTFFVRDDGAGFDMRYAKNLFGAFQRLHTPDQFEGTGIGLATVQRIVHRHGGAVWAEGEIEKGATFWFTLEPPDAA